MKKLYRKGTVHPSPSLSSPSQTSPPRSSSSSSSSSSCTELFSLAFLPAAILTLAAALTAEDRDVLAYLLSCSSSVSPFDYFLSPKTNHVTKKKSSNQQHPPSFNCYCFSCYTSYWARWDSSPNRQLIHEIIDAFEDGLVKQGKKNNNNSNKKHGISRRERRKNKGVSFGDADDGQLRMNDDIGRAEFDKNDHHGHDHDDHDETGEREGSVKKIVSFIGERIWGSVWG